MRHDHQRRRPTLAHQFNKAIADDCWEAVGGVFGTDTSGTTARESEDGAETVDGEVVGGDVFDCVGWAYGWEGEDFVDCRDVRVFGAVEGRFYVLG